MGGTVGSSQFQIQFKDNRRSNNPVKGITAILHNEDHKTFVPENVKVSDKDGVVDFGDVGRHRGTITIDKKSLFSRAISSFVDVPLGKFIYYLDESVWGNADCQSGQANVKVDLKNSIERSARYWQMRPVNRAGDAPFTEPESISLCDGNLQVDNKMTILATTTSLTNELIGYGFLLDQEVVDDQEYVIDINKNPSSITAPPARE